MQKPEMKNHPRLKLNYMNTVDKLFYMNCQFVYSWVLNQL